MPRLVPAVLALPFVCAPALAQQAPCVGGLAAGYACDNVDLLAHMPLAAFGPGGVRGSEGWGWTDPDTGREYAMWGLVDAVVFIDVTEPTAPVYIGRLPSAVPDPFYGRWRVFRTYANHLFVGSEIRGHGVQVFDLTRLRGLSGPPQTFAADARYTGAGYTHTLTIDEATGFMYLAGGREGGTICNGGGLHIVDVRNPIEPAYAGCFQDNNGMGDMDTYVHEAECVTYHGPDPDYQGREICVTYAEESVTFVDVTDKGAPTLISRAFYPDYAYTHQGTFTADGRFILLNDELDETAGTFTTARTVILDAEDLDDVEYVGAYLSSVPSTDHNLYVRGQYVFQSNYAAGLRILDASDIASGTLTEVGYFDTFPQGDYAGFDGQWMNYPYFASGNVVAFDRDNGVFVLRPTFDIVSAESPPAPLGYTLSGPSPNPFAARASFTFTVERGQHVRVEAFDGLGRRVAAPFDGFAAAGIPYTVGVDAGTLAAGPFVLRLLGETFSTSRPFTLQR